MESTYKLDWQNAPRFIGLAFLFLPQVGVANLERFESVEQVLAELRLDSDVSFSRKDGWLIAESDFTLWSFTPDTHPAHPAVVERRVYEEGSKVKVATRVICTASRSSCDQLVSEFTALNEGVRRRLSEAHSSSSQLLKQPGLTIGYDEADGWQVIRRAFAILALRKSGTDGDSTVASTQLYRLPEFDSEESFLSFVEDQRKNSHAEDARVVDPKVRERLTKHKSATCVSYSYRYVDAGAVMGDGSKTEAMFVDNGMRCIHPHDRSIGVHIGYSKRHFGTLDYQLFEEEARAFHNQIEFEAFESPAE